MPLHFHEAQKFTQWWIWILLLLTASIPAYGLFKQLVLDQPFGNNPMSTLGLVVFLLSVIAIMALFFSMTLRTTINEEGVRYSFSPFTSGEVNWDEIASAEVTNYGFVGGYGIRKSFTYGTVYNTSGKIGLALQLKSGKKLCIGTQKGDELSSVIAEARRQGKLPPQAAT